MKIHGIIVTYQRYQTDQTRYENQLHIADNNYIPLKQVQLAVELRRRLMNFLQTQIIQWLYVINFLKHF